MDSLNKKPKKKLATWKKVLIVILILLLVFCGSLVAITSAMLGKINRVDPNQDDTEYTGEEFETDVDPAGDTLKPEDVTWPENQSEADKDEDNVVNILLIGQDRRPGQGRQRSDSMMIASINKKAKTVTVTSILRDSYVQIPGHQDNRINAAYAFGGMSLLDETINLNFGIKIDANVEVDFDGFKTIIDTLGGVDIVIKDYEVDYFNDGDPNGKFFAGLNHLDGKEALRYARTRYVGRSDFERTQRQRTIITALFNKVKNENPTKILTLINQLFPCLTTDMSNSDIIYYATLVMQMNLNEIQTYRVPADGNYSSQTIRGMMVLVPDLEACRADLKSIIYGE